MCIVPRCRRPRLRGPRCSLHRRIWQQMAPAMRLTHRMRDLVVQHTPVDVVDFLCWYPAIRHDVVLCLAVALLKEPTATKAFVESALAATQGMPRPLTTVEYQATFHSVLDKVNGGPHLWELRSLGRQGFLRSNICLRMCI